MFAQMSVEQWTRVVSLSIKNERLITEEEYPDSPDLGFMHIQDAIFRLLEIAPVHVAWVRLLYDLLDNLNYQKVETPKNIDHVLARWAALDDRDSDGKPHEGYFTSLPLKDEFRCFVAALYGRGYVSNRWTPSAALLHGDLWPIGIVGRQAPRGAKFGDSFENLGAKIIAHILEFAKGRIKLLPRIAQTERVAEKKAVQERAIDG